MLDPETININVALSGEIADSTHDLISNPP